MTEDADALVELTGVAETLLMPLYNRGTEAARPHGLINDPWAARTLARVRYPFAERFGAPNLMHPLRSLMFDREVRRFLAARPRGTVVSLGEGLETELWRVDNGEVDWLTVDLPEVIELRRRFLPPIARNRCWAGSAFDLAWMDEVEPARGVLVLAQGLFGYFAEGEVLALLRACAERFPGATALFDMVPHWAAAASGRQKSDGYRTPPILWTRDATTWAKLAGLHPAVAEVTAVWLPRGRGIGFGVAYPVLRRVPGARRLLPFAIRIRFAGAITPRS